MGNREDVALVDLTSGTNYLRLGDLQTALEQDAQVSTRGQVYRLGARAWSAEPAPDHRRALGLLERGVLWARREENLQLEQELLVDLAVLRRSIGDLDGAWTVRDQADLLRTRVREEQLQRRLAALQVRLEIQGLQEREQELELANRELERIGGDQALLIKVLGHDLRSPLATVLTAADLMAGGRLDAQQVQELGVRLGDASRRLVHLLDALTSEDAVRSGQRRTRFEDVDAHPTLEPLLRAWRRRAEAKGITLEGSCPDALLRADRVALGQVVDNLLSNAVKFTPRGGTVRFQLRSASPVCLCVDDSGPGIAPDEQELVFQRFARGRAEPTGGESSTGLGLFVVRHLARMMGGDVTSEASELGGVRMSVTLPQTES